ncbi:DUF6320 domain-containing protein [Paenibacillus donghaensis]|uniref:Uncharacterized protein n=1 Tax=Paenibacillus donghaensis TaxID=414771 RepID=A0A2Z2KKK5_9BACL|nr:DUF6320 domain-containing protein [Paenibacillus donghaensis]ASA23880.1 hypothetical protein B9T62_25710 [Paenibacillus donghaensis]
MKGNSLRAKTIAVLIISVLFMIGIFVPVLVNYILDGKLTWSLFSLGAIVMAWVTLVPVIIASKHKALFGLLGLSLTLLPFLYLTDYLAPYENWFENLAWPLVMIILPALWLIVLFAELVKASLNLKFAFVLIVLAALMVGIDYTVSEFLNEPVDQPMLLLKPAVAVVGALLLVIAQLLRRNMRSAQ